MTRCEVFRLFIILVYSRLGLSYSEGTANYLIDARGTGEDSTILLLKSLKDRLSTLSAKIEMAETSKLTPYREFKQHVGRGLELPWYIKRSEGDDWESHEFRKKYNFPLWSADFKFLLQKRQRPACDTSRITLQTLIEYLETGRICGRRVAHVRFGLGGRRR